MKVKLPWILAACVVASLAVLAAARSAPEPVTFTVQPDSVEIPFLLRSNHVLVRGRINDSDSLWFVLDSGAGSHVVNRAGAEQLGLEVKGGVEAMGAGGRVAAGRAPDVHFHLPGIEIMSPFAAVIDLDNVALQSGRIATVSWAFRCSITPRSRSTTRAPCSSSGIPRVSGRTRPGSS